jgi:hypothetical protein
MSGVAIDDLRDVQAELYEHLVADAGGRCTTCHEPEPCRRRGELHRSLLRYGQLPKRQPGRTKAGLVRRG